MWSDNSTESSWLTGYEITYSPQKEVSSLNDEIKIKLKYDKVAKYYHNLTIKLSGGNYISEDSYVESDSNISIHTLPLCPYTCCYAFLFTFLLRIFPLVLLAAESVFLALIFLFLAHLSPPSLLLLFFLHPKSGSQSN